MEPKIEYDAAYYQRRYDSLVFTSGEAHNFLDRYRDQTNAPEQVDVSAIIHPDGTYFAVSRPGRHHDLIRHMAGLNKGGLANVSKQGFLTTHGRFVDRKEGLRIAVDQKQLLDMSEDARRSDLFSEDLYE